MEIIKIVSLALVICMIATMIREVKREYFLPIIIIGGVVILLNVISSITDIFSLFNTIVNKTNINTELFTIILKIIGVGYLIEFTSNICIDSGCSSISDKLILSGKIIIFVMSIPIIKSLFEIILDLML